MNRLLFLLPLAFIGCSSVSNSPMVPLAVKSESLQKHTFTINAKDVEHSCEHIFFPQLFQNTPFCNEENNAFNNYLSKESKEYNLISSIESTDDNSILIFSTFEKKLDVDVSVCKLNENSFKIKTETVSTGFNFIEVPLKEDSNIILKGY